MEITETDRDDSYFESIDINFKLALNFEVENNTWAYPFGFTAFFWQLPNLELV